MAVLDISEYPVLRNASYGQPLYAGVEPSIAFQQLSNAGASGVGVTSNAFQSNTGAIRVHSDAPCRIVISSTGVAATTATGFRLAAGTTEYFNVTAGQKLNVITST